MTSNMTPYLIADATLNQELYQLYADVFSDAIGIFRRPEKQAAER